MDDRLSALKVRRKALKFNETGLLNGLQELYPFI